MENDLRNDGERYEYLESTFLPDLRIDQKEGPSERDIPADRRRKSKGDVGGDRKAEGDTKLDLIYSDGKIMIFGKEKQHPEDKSTVMIIPGMNDSIILEMGRLGLLKGKARVIYKKLK